MHFPDRKEYADYYYTYIKKVPSVHPLLLLRKTRAYTLSVLESLSEKKQNYAYAEGKWTPKEMLQHIIDTEQILSYRALRFVRLDYQNALPFDENAYVDALNNTSLDWNYLLKSMDLLRQSTIHFFEGLSPSQCKLGGSPIFDCTVQAIATIIGAHELHHIYVLQECYLKQKPIPFIDVI